MDPLTHLQIHDTVTKLYWAFDTHQPDKLRSDVFAKRIHVDYTSFFGGEPTQRSNEELVADWTALMEKIEASQHVVTGILPLFPEGGLAPGENPPGRINVVANGTAYLRKKVSDGRVLETRNGGRMELVVQREEEVKSGNPWRIASLKAIPVWDEGGREFWGAQ